MRKQPKRIELFVDLAMNENDEVTMKFWTPRKKHVGVLAGNVPTHTDRKRLFLDIEEYLTDRIGEYVIEHDISTTEFGK
jgi:hypothetical protein